MVVRLLLHNFAIFSNLERLVLRTRSETTFGRHAARTEISRREVIGTSTAAALATLTAFDAAPALAGNIPSGFSAISDSNKNYAFLIPFGWQVR